MLRAKGMEPAPGALLCRALWSAFIVTGSSRGDVQSGIFILCDF